LISKDTKVIVVGGEGERLMVESIQESFIAHKNILFKITALEELINLISYCGLFIGLDSGPMNLAVCLGKKAIALFGPGDSEMWQPLSEGSTFVHKKELFSCSPCPQTHCQYPEKNCMASIEVDDVFSLLN